MPVNSPVNRYFVPDSSINGPVIPVTDSGITSNRMETKTQNTDPRHLMELGALGILAEESADKPTVRERLQHNFSRYWTASHGMLDPTIERLRTAEHIAMISPMTVEEEPPATEYEITERGRERLQELLGEPIDADIVAARHPHFMLKVGFPHHLPPAEQDEQLAALADIFEQARNRWMDIKATHQAIDAPSRNSRSGSTIRILSGWMNSDRADSEARPALTSSGVEGDQRLS